MKKEFIPKPRYVIFDPSDVFQNGVFRVRMESFLRRAQNSELNISKKNFYSRRIGPASGRRASALFVPYVLNVRLCVLCVLNVLNVLNVRAS